MNSTDLNSTNAFTQQAVTRNSSLWPTAFPKQANDSAIYVVTTTLPARDQNTIIGAVIFAMLVTLGIAAFVLYRYMCRNKGDYRTTGEPAPGDYFFEESNTHGSSEKKEYFI